ncbi:hypothetical protein J6590_036920 [Homalodisca vitripennis]|nr:hypothetical protein J6590_036920 [Homalodisca vitripennis]
MPTSVFSSRTKVPVLSTLMCTLYKLYKALTRYCILLILVGRWAVPGSYQKGLERESVQYKVDDTDKNAKVTDRI